jgi:hypothetical protein
MEYWIADEVAEIVESFRKYHADLIGASIGCIFKEKASKSDGEPIIGKITKVSEKNKILMSEPYDYVIEIGNDAWQELNNAQKEAWVDHLMEHAYGEESEQTGDMSWKMRKPEIQIFPCIISRHGINWMPGLPKLATMPFAQKAVAVDPTKRTAESAEDESDKRSISDILEDLN